jgi:hypothetical protein
MKLWFRLILLISAVQLFTLQVLGVTISWDAGGSDVTGYNIYERVGGSSESVYSQEIIIPSVPGGFFMR